MDIQLKRGLLDAAVLAAIKDADSYGYKIIKDMKAAKMLTVRTAEHEGRLRKYYHIEKPGLKRLDEFRADWKEIMAVYRFITKEDDVNG